MTSPGKDMIKKRVEKIVKQLNELYGDTSVGPDKTRDALKQIREEIDGLLEAL